MPASLPSSHNVTFEKNGTEEKGIRARERFEVLVF